jgi:hypothetical protein
MNPLPTKQNRWRPITVLNLLVGLLFSLSALAQPAFLKEGLLAYYPFNSGVVDESGNGYTPKTINKIIFSKDRFNNDSSSASFGTEFNSFIEIPNLLNDYSRATISIWMRYQGAKSQSPQVLFNKPRGDNLAGLTITFHGTGIGSGFFNEDGGERVFNDGWAGGVPVGTWVNYILIVDGVSCRAFQDGKLVLSGKVNTIPAQSTKPFIIGALDYGVWSYAGELDDVRIYNRALSDGEVQVLYDYESTPPQNNLNPRIATATAQVVNGFVVGTTISDAGYGYVSNPVITITGGGGAGAKATALQVDGVVTSITITNPGSGYTSTPTITIAPPPFPPKKATATSQIVNGFVVGTKITDGGFGYDSPPAVLLVGGGGSGATAVATVADGVITAIAISNPGTGYTSSPIVRIASPPFAPKLAIETSKVFVRMSVVLGRKYQLEASTDLNTWTSTGPAFIAQDEELVQEFDVNQVGQYFRINQVP